MKTNLFDKKLPIETTEVQKFWGCFGTANISVFMLKQSWQTFSPKVCKIKEKMCIIEKYVGKNTNPIFVWGYLLIGTVIVIGKFYFSKSLPCNIMPFELGLPA